MNPIRLWERYFDRKRARANRRAQTRRAVVAALRGVEHEPDVARALLDAERAAGVVVDVDRRGNVTMRDWTTDDRVVTRGGAVVWADTLAPCTLPRAPAALFADAGEVEGDAIPVPCALPAVRS